MNKAHHIRNAGLQTVQHDGHSNTTNHPLYQQSQTITDNYKTSDLSNIQRNNFTQMESSAHFNTGLATPIIANHNHTFEQHPLSAKNLTHEAHSRKNSTKAATSSINAFGRRSSRQYSNLGGRTTPGPSSLIAEHKHRLKSANFGHRKNSTATAKRSFTPFQGESTSFHKRSDSVSQPKSFPSIGGG